MTTQMTETIATVLAQNATTRASEIAVHRKSNDAWQGVTWADYQADTCKVAKSLMAIGLERGDSVAVLSGNRYEWFLSATGAIAAGVMVTGVYGTNSSQEVAHVVNDSGSQVIVVEDAAQLDKVKAEWGNMPKLLHVVMLEDDNDSDPRVMSWGDFLAKGQGVDDAALDARQAEILSDDVATLIYTSGTTGLPKGAMLTHANIVWAAQQTGRSLGVDADAIVMSYLPLAHIAEQLASVHVAISHGYQVYICSEPLKLADYIKDVRPTFFFGVPRVWEKFYGAITARLQDASGVKAKISDWAFKAGAEMAQARRDGKEPGFILKKKYGIANKLVFSKIKDAIGFGRASGFATGSAATPDAVMELFSSMGMNLLELYGQTEGCAITTINTAQHFKVGTVGKPVPGIDVKIADDGEIFFKGPSTFKGYIGKSAETAETFEGDWVKTGDLGQFDEDGYLSIIGRKKDIIITSGGKNIAPIAIENALMALDGVGQAVVMGEGQRYVVALITPDQDALERLGQKFNVAAEDVWQCDHLRKALEKDISENVNTQFARVEQVRNFEILQHPFSPETGEATVTFKIKRNVVNERYADRIRELYARGAIM